tara:strand:- start:1827 stop:2333 length:507 start_codon:yes stop_codon:yes gene_type:complete
VEGGVEVLNAAKRIVLQSLFFLSSDGIDSGFCCISPRADTAAAAALARLQENAEDIIKVARAPPRPPPTLLSQLKDDDAPRKTQRFDAPELSSILHFCIIFPVTPARTQSETLPEDETARLPIPILRNNTACLRVIVAIAVVARLLLLPRRTTPPPLPHNTGGLFSIE